MKIERTGSAAWQGGLRDGKGVVSTESGLAAAAFATLAAGAKSDCPVSRFLNARITRDAALV